MRPGEQRKSEDLRTPPRPGRGLRAQSPRFHASAHLARNSGPRVPTRPLARAPPPPGPWPIGRAPPAERWLRRGLGAERHRPPSALAHWLRPRGCPETGVHRDWLQRFATAASIGCDSPRDAEWRLAPVSEGLLLVRF